jgi:transcriptional regulator with XRE-family HTH domain
VVTGKRGGTNQRPTLPDNSPYLGRRYDVADVLTPLCKAHGWTVRRLAQALGCDPSIPSAWANGKRLMPGYWVPTVARVLGISEDTLTERGGVAVSTARPRSRAPRVAVVRTPRRRTLSERPCATCKDLFQPRWDYQVTCSEPCYGRHRRASARTPSVPKPCAVCGHDFTPRDTTGRYCGDACRHQANLAVKTAARVARKQARPADAPTHGPALPIGKAVALTPPDPTRWALTHRCQQCRKPMILAGVCWQCSTGRPRRILMPAERIWQAETVAA